MNFDRHENIFDKFICHKYFTFSNFIYNYYKYFSIINIFDKFIYYIVYTIPLYIILHTFSFFFFFF